MDGYIRSLLTAGHNVARTIRGCRRLVQAASVVLVLGLAVCASADVITVRRNLDKYWYYRGRLLTKFLVPGLGQGYSIPACWYNLDMHCINWGDGTIDLGWYIGSLATEHYMLTRTELFPGYVTGGGDLNQVRNELYWALSALDRLDATAEACWNPLAPDTPGFFIRDDVPADFYTHFPDMATVWSDFTNTDALAKEMSQDQVVHVLLGLSLVKKLIPADLVVNGKNLRQSAINRGSQIVDWVHQHDWTIYNPVTNIAVNRGPDARSFSTGFNKTCVYLTDGAVNFSGSISGFWAWVWSTLSSPTNPAYDNYNNQHMAMSLAATGNGWSDSTLDGLMSLADPYDWYAYPMLYAVLYDSIAQSRPTWAGHQATFNGSVQTMLNQAPVSGPHLPNSPEEENTGWCADRKFIRNLETQNHGGGGTGMQYPGLDYLLLHNLFYVVTPSLWQDPSPPDPATNPSPANGATGVSVNNPTLSWTAGSRATSHDVYFGTSNPPTFRQNQTGTTYAPGTLTESTTYYWRIDEKGTVGTTTGTVWSFGTVAIPPGPVTGFTAVQTDNGQVTLNWTNPSDPDYAGTRILFRTDTYPSGPNDASATVIYDQGGTTFIHSGLTNGQIYYYAAFAYDAVPNYSTRVTASATPMYIPPPGPVTNFKTYGGNERVDLAWTNPTDPDPVGIKILCKAVSGYPISPNDPSATVIFDAPGTSYSHTGLSNGTKYYYAAYAYTGPTSFSAVAQSSAYAAAEASIPTMKGLANSVVRALKGNIVTAVFSGNFYIQDPLKPFGLKVSTTETALPSIGQQVDVVGSMTGVPGAERAFSSTGSWIRVTDPGPITIVPAALNNKAVGGANLNAYTPGVVGGMGANNIGLLVRVCGKVTQIQPGQYFYVDDGCGLKDGTQTVGIDNVGVRIKTSPPTGVETNKYVVVTGIVSPFSSSGLRRQILPLPQPAGVWVAGP